MDKTFLSRFLEPQMALSSMCKPWHTWRRVSTEFLLIRQHLQGAYYRWRIESQDVRFLSCYPEQHVKSFASEIFHRMLCSGTWWLWVTDASEIKLQIKQWQYICVRRPPKQWVVPCLISPRRSQYMDPPFPSQYQSSWVDTGTKNVIVVIGKGYSGRHSSPCQLNSLLTRSQNSADFLPTGK